MDDHDEQHDTTPQTQARKPKRPEIPRAWEDGISKWPRRGPLELRGADGQALAVFHNFTEATDALLELVGRPDFDVAAYADPPLAPRRAVALYWTGVAGNGEHLVGTFDDHATAELEAQARARRHSLPARQFDPTQTVATVLQRFRFDPPRPLDA